MKIAIVGLGKMGFQIVEKLLAEGVEVVASDRNEEALHNAGSKGAIEAGSRQDVVSKFGDETVIVWLMIPSEFVEEEINEWQNILPEGSILIDGGNSDFRLSKQRFEQLAGHNIDFVDVGTSGGIKGITNGFSMMVGGKHEAYEKITFALDILSKPSGSFNYFGSGGSGHFVKMVHNAIEYGVMESLAEGYRFLKEGPYKELDLAKIAEVWQHGSIIESSLNGLAMQAFQENPNMDGIEGIVAESGEARWTLEAARDHNVPMPVVQAAFDVRIQSENGQISFATKLLAVLRNKFGGHAQNPK